MLFPELADYSDWGLLVLRVAVGIVFVVHGWPKITGARQMVEAMMGGPNPAAATVFTIQGLVETLGGIALLLGVLTQLVAIAFGIIMIGAILLKINQMHVGFTAQQATGWEFDAVLLAAAVLLLFVGPGEFALQA